MSIDRYRMSFTTGGLFCRESVIAYTLFTRLNDWQKVREMIINENLLQLRTESSGKRVSLELCARLKQLSKAELPLVGEGTAPEQKAVLWLAVCRHYRFIREFATEVIRAKFVTFQYELFYDDFDAFFNAKAAWIEELDVVADSTKAKLRQVLFKMMHEADILSDANRITPMLPTTRLVRAVESLSEFGVFPVLESDIMRCADA